MSWEKRRLGDVLKYEQPTKYLVDSSDYSDEFETPVLTAGKSFILGYTDETKGIFTELPTIIFDDFTADFKYVDFPFKAKSSAMKMLKAVTEVADTKFLFYLMQTLNTDCSQHKRHWISKFAELQIPLPPLPIQKRIAEILDAADALKRKDQELLKKYDELAEAIFIDMFGDPVRNEKGWEVKNIGSQMRSIRYGTGSPPIYCSIGIPFIRATNIKNGRVEEKGMVYVNKEEANKIKKCYLNEGDLLIVRSGANTGDCAYITDEYSSSLGGFDLIIEMENVKSRFYNFFINSIWGKAIIEKLSRRAGQPHLNSEQVSNIECILPSYGKLQTFKLIIDNLELTRKQIVNSRLKNNDLFNSLIQKAFKEELVS